MALRAQRFTTFDRLKLLLILSALIAQCTVLEGAGTAAPVSIKRSEHLSVDGAKLYLQIRSTNRTAPVLIWLHGGPGGAERPLFRYFNGDLEKRFVVVYWDQRGAGRSFDPKADPHRLTIAQHLADLDIVVNHPRQSLGQNKIVLMGHSWGAALGALYAQPHPEKVSAFIAVNPLIATLKGHANNVSLEAMNTELLSLDLSRSVSAVDVPVLFFVGRYDRHADAKLAAAYFETLHALVKRVQ